MRMSHFDNGILCAAAFAAASLCPAALPAQGKVFYTPEPTLGISVLAPEMNEWQTPPMYAPGQRPTMDEHFAVGDDFFVREFGTPLSGFAFTNGFRRCWGRNPSQPDDVAVRFGRGWGRSEGRKYQLWMDVEQSAGETSWEWLTWEGRYPKRTAFTAKAKPGERSSVRQTLGDVRGLVPVTAVELGCLSSNASVKVGSVRIVPVSVPMRWRGTFALPFRPWKGGLSMVRPPSYRLLVNGREVSRGLDIDGQETLRLDVTDCLSRGTNVIEVIGEYSRGYATAGELAIEAFAVSDKGETMLMKPADWKVRIAERDWAAPRFSANPANRIGFAHMVDGRQVATGVRPIHAGPLQVSHRGQQYPVFDCEDAEIAWDVKLPPALTGFAAEGVVSNSLTGKVCERIAATGGVARASTRAAGAYMIHWTLSDGKGKVVDRERTEMMVAGPVEQTLCEFADFDRTLDSRLKTVQAVDCTRKETDPRRFAEHSWQARLMGKDDAWRSATGSEGGIAFRETGVHNGDWFAYKLDVERLGQAHVLDVDYPDTREQILYVSVKEEYPVGFMNNTPKGGSAWPNASGAVRTGWMTPLTNGRRTMRLVFFPGSKNVTVSFQNGGIGRAAVCGFRLNEVGGEGLPALKLPKTGRLFGSHCERPLCGQWGAAVNGALYQTWTEYREGMYAAAFLGIANRIRHLRYMGQNLAIDGTYMYKQGFPTESGESYTARPSFDYCLALAKMYRRNGIRAFAGFEYLAAPSILLGGGYDVGDREMAAAKAPVVPSHTVDRHGRQVVGFAGMGLNYLAPHVWRSITNLVGEVYGRYASTGGFEGLFVVNNGWWLPGYPTLKGMSEGDIGYDDLSVSLFERETGIALGVPYSPDRFARRHELLTSRYGREWFGWRARKMRESLDEISRICRGGTVDWTVYAVPGMRRDNAANPFPRKDSSFGERSGYVLKGMAEAAFPNEVWGDGGGARMIPQMGYERSLDLASWGMSMSAGANALRRRQDACYFNTGLNERWVESSRLDGWWWRSAVSTVYDVRPSGEAAYFNLVDVCADYAPNVMLNSWLDVNVPTAHGRESRRFAAAFCDIPDGEGEPLPSVTGVSAKVFADGRVLLVNDTPHAASGTLAARMLGFPLAIGETFGGKGRGSLRIRLDGYGMTVVSVQNARKTLSGAFSFENRSVARKAMEDAKCILSNARLCAELPTESHEALKRGVATGDHYSLAAALRSYEVRRLADPFLALVSGTANPMRREGMKVIGGYDGPEPMRFRKGVPGQGFAAKVKKAKHPTARRTLSMLVRSGGKGSDMLFHENPFRFDIHSTGKGLRPTMTVFRVKPRQKGWIHVGLGEGEAVASGKWHHVCFTVDPDGYAALWIDGNLSDAKELDDWKGLSLTLGDGTLLGSRPTVAEGLDETDFAISRLAYREGVMDWRDIQREAEEWLADVPQEETWRTVTLTAADAGRVIDGKGRTVSCGREITGWKVGEDGIWYASAPKGCPPPGALFVNGEPRHVAEYPTDGSRLEACDLSYGTWRSSQNGGLNPPARPWELLHVTVDPKDIPHGLDLKGASINRFHVWDESSAEILGYDPKKGIVTLATPMEYPSGMIGWPKGYVLRNLRIGMSMGRWMHDRRTDMILYWPYEQEAATGFRAEIPMSMSAFRLEKGADRITIRNFRFRLGNRTFGTPGLRGVNPLGLIDAVDAYGLTVEDCEFLDSAGQGVKLLRSPGYTVRRCSFRNLGAGGVTAIHSYEGRVKDCTFRRIGTVAASSCAILAGGDSTLLYVKNGYPNETGTTTIARNRIEDVPYCGIVVCGRGHVVERNVIVRPMRVLRDGAAIYLSRGENCTVRDNVAKTDSVSGAHAKAHSYYLDEFSRNTVVSGNVSEGFAHPVLLHRSLDCSYVSNRFSNVHGDMMFRGLVSQGITVSGNDISTSGRFIVKGLSAETVKCNRINAAGGIVCEGSEPTSVAFVAEKDGYMGIRTKDSVTAGSEKWRKIVVVMDDEQVGRAFADEMSKALPSAARGVKVVFGTVEMHPDADCAVIGFVPKGEWLGKSPSFERSAERERVRSEACAAFTNGLQRTFNAAKGRGMARVVLTPFPIDEYSPNKDGTPCADYGNSLFVGAHLRSLKDFAPHNNPIAVVDTHIVLSRMLDAGERGLVDADRVTPLRKSIRIAARETVGTIFRSADRLRTYR